MTLNRRTLTLGILLSGLAGFVDAEGFLHLGGGFVSFMSGNSTRFAVAAAQGHAAEALASGALILLFLAGTMLGAAVDRIAGRSSRPAVLATEAALLLAAASLHGLGSDRPAIAAMLLAMGCENAVFVQGGRVSAGLTYMTGALVRLGQGLVAALAGESPAPLMPDALQWTALVLGAVLGARTYAAVGLHGLWGAALLALACALWTAVDPRTAARRAT